MNFVLISLHFSIILIGSVAEAESVADGEYINESPAPASLDDIVKFSDSYTVSDDSSGPNLRLFNHINDFSILSLKFASSEDVLALIVVLILSNSVINFSMIKSFITSAIETIVLKFICFAVFKCCILPSIKVINLVLSLDILSNIGNISSILSFMVLAALNKILGLLLKR